MSNPVEYSILFVNNTNLPILVESWNRLSNNFLKLQNVCVNASEEKMIYSATKEWYLTNYFYDKEIIEQWKGHNFKVGYKIGKFRSVPSYNGEYAWLDDDTFKILYDDNKIIFSYK